MHAQAILSTLSTVLLALPLNTVAAPTPSVSSTLVTSPDYNFALKVYGKSSPSRFDGQVLKPYLWDAKLVNKGYEYSYYTLKPVVDTSDYYRMVNGSLVNYLKNGTADTFISYASCDTNILALPFVEAYAEQNNGTYALNKQGKLVVTESSCENGTIGTDHWKLCYGQLEGYTTYLVWDYDLSAKNCTDVWVEAAEVKA